MFETVEIKLWLLVLIVLFAAVTALSHVLVPSVRWFFRRRMERVVSRLNERLSVPIQPFKLARRHDMIQRLIYDPKVAEAVAEHARTEAMPEAVAFEHARRYAREIVPSFSATAYFGFGIRVAKFLSRAFYRVRLGYVDEAALDSIDPGATVIFVMNHRSNMDYVLVTYLAAERSALSYAVGEWAGIWPLSALIRSMGGYFIRRNSRNPLYRRVLARYVQLATAGGVTQAVFPEGGLSLDGRVGPPKLGLISYITAGHDPATSRDVVFVPIGLNYDRVIEDRILQSAASKGRRKFRFNPLMLLRYAGRQLRRRMSGKFYRFGYASVSFGTPLSLSDFMADCAEEDVNQALGNTLMDRVRDVVPVLPVPLVAAILMRGGDDGITRQALQEQLDTWVARLESRGIHVHVPRDDPAYGAEVGLRQLLLRRIVAEQGGLVRIVPAQRALAAYYAATIEHHLRNFDAT